MSGRDRGERPTIPRALRRIAAARERLRKTLSDLARDGGRYGGGLASEGYAGGYYAALNDVEAVLRGVPVSEKDGRYWRDGT
jgi:hypothetical protein